jgi:hypothetical protein
VDYLQAGSTSVRELGLLLASRFSVAFLYWLFLPVSISSREIMLSQINLACIPLFEYVCRFISKWCE